MATRTFNVDLYQSHIARSHTETFQVQAETEAEAMLAAQEIVDAKDPAIEGDYDFEVQAAPEPLANGLPISPVPEGEPTAADEAQPQPEAPQPAESLNDPQLAEKQREDQGHSATVEQPADQNRDDVGRTGTINPDDL